METHRREPLTAAGIAGVSAALLVLLAPPGGDSAAHLYRTELLRDGVALWDNLWFGGHYPLASYSLLYYLPAAILGNVPLVVAATVASAALFASLVLREWGGAARWPARAFAVAAAGPLFTGTYSYAVGLTAALAALRLLQARRPVLAAGASALALGFSPLAFAFLVLALAALWVSRRPNRRRVLLVAGGVAVAAIAQVLALTAFPSDGRYPFSPLSLAAVLGVCALGGFVALRAPRGRPLAAFFALWAAANVAAFAVPTPFGDNLTRMRGLVFPLVLLAAVTAKFRPRPLAVGATVFAFAYNVAPDVSALPKRIDDRRTADAAFWQPALDFVRATPGHQQFRVEVVPTFGHWEALWVPRAGLALARGWYRQIDLAENSVLYEDPLQAHAYHAWLRRLGVRHVLLPHARLGPMGADREAALLRSGQSDLRAVFRTRDWTVYELPDATPILTGPGRPRIVRLAHARVEAVTTARGTHRLRIRHTPYWKVARGAACVAAAAGGMTRLVVQAPGPLVLVADADAGTVLRTALGKAGECDE